jgi:RNA polymerase II C-terminal domain phosphatase-like 1/2
MESGRSFVQYGGTFGVLEEIAVKCGFKVASMIKKII